MHLSFITIDSSENDFTFDLHDIPEQITNEIILSLELDHEKQYVISFPSFTDYNKEIHGKAIKYFFHDACKHITRKVVGEDQLNEQVTYSFENEKLVNDNLNHDQLKFLCAIFHKLNLKKYLVSCLGLLLDKYKFNEIKDHCKNEMYKMIIFHK